MIANDIMTVPMISVGLDTPVRDVARTLIEHRISAVPVLTREGELAGIVSEADLLRRPEVATQYESPWLLALMESENEAARRIARTVGQCAGDVMSRDVVTVDRECGLDEIASLLEGRHIKRVVVTRSGKPCGVVSRADLVRVLASAGFAHSMRQQSDDHLRQAILELYRKLDIRPAYANVVVTQGVAWLWGSVCSEEVRDQIHSNVTKMPGVRQVEDKLSVRPNAPLAF